MPSKRQSVAVLSFVLLIIVVSSVFSGFVTLPESFLSLDPFSELDQDRVTEVKSLVDWAETNTRIVRLDELPTVGSIDGGRPIVLRFDDVRDSAYRDGITAFLEMMLQKKVKVTLGIVAGDFGAEPLLSLVRRGVQEGYFEVAIHGWLHEDFAALGETQMTELIRNAKNKLQGLFPETTVSTLIPPFEEVNTEVLRAAAANGLRYVTSDLAHGQPYDWDGVRFLPKTVDTGMPGLRADDQWTMYDQATTINAVEKSIATYGYAIITVHPQQLTKHWTATAISFILVGAAVAVIVLVCLFELAIRAEKRKREKAKGSSMGSMRP